MSSSKDSAGLQAELIAKTEEAYQVMLENNLSNEEQTQVRKKRSVKSEDYLQIFRKYLNGLQMGNRGATEGLMKDLRELAITSMREQASRLSQQPQQSFEHAPQVGREEVFVPQQNDDFRNRLAKVLLNYLQDSNTFSS